jgi:hypothetical protein
MTPQRFSVWRSGDEPSDILSFVTTHNWAVSFRPRFLYLMDPIWRAPEALEKSKNLSLLGVET